jgi:Zn-dependent M16 (insulinase) family peptidase
MQVEIFEKLKNEDSTFWIKLIEKWLYKKNTITITAKPSEDLMRSIGKEDKRRVNERKSLLGKKGLRELEIKLQNAIDENDVSDSFYLYF